MRRSIALSLPPQLVFPSLQKIVSKFTPKKFYEIDQGLSAIKFNKRYVRQCCRNTSNLRSYCVDFTELAMFNSKQSKQRKLISRASSNPPRRPSNQFFKTFSCSKLYP